MMNVFSLRHVKKTILNNLKPFNTNVAAASEKYDPTLDDAGIPNVHRLFTLLPQIRRSEKSVKDFVKT